MDGYLGPLCDGLLTLLRQLRQESFLVQRCPRLPGRFVRLFIGGYLLLLLHCVEEDDSAASCNLPQLGLELKTGRRKERKREKSVLQVSVGEVAK